MTPELRALFPITQRAVYLNHAAVSPLPVPTIEAVESQLRDVHKNGSINFRDWLGVKQSARVLLAELLNARPEQVAFTRNTSDGLSTVANGISWRTGDNIVTFKHEFPSNIYPWLRITQPLGVELRTCDEHNGRIDLDELASLVNQQTKVIAISQVQFASGFRVDLERLGKLARQYDALLVVDTIQALGVIPTDVQAELIDVAAGAGHKWLLSPEGTGYLYLSDRARDRIEPTLVGWVSVPDPEDHFNWNQGWNEGALAWETGTGPAALIYGLEASLRLIRYQGVRRIQKYLQELTDYLCFQLGSKDYEIVSSRLENEQSQIVCIRHTGGIGAMELYSRLKQRRIITAPRVDRLRIAPHFYNTFEDIDSLVAALP
ncbi:MAG TPA: aminotransferase class V-fold PLP-dependent enzyme [Pyrinomonadaceae bacterium]|jgi:selenocysteine lyase/cysteine desulfurase|nr:aminotransferase class V-fold PLP-dependent enzyme [Pyrinomonadaceae bacterium]